MVYLSTLHILILKRPSVLSGDILNYDEPDGFSMVPRFPRNKAGRSHFNLSSPRVD